MPACTLIPAATALSAAAPAAATGAAGLAGATAAAAPALAAAAPAIAAAAAPVAADAAGTGMAALSGSGISDALTSGIQAGMGASPGLDASGLDTLGSTLGTAGNIGDSAIPGVSGASSPFGAATQYADGLTSLNSQGIDALTSGAGSNADPSPLDSIKTYLGKQGILPLALAGSLGAAGLSSLFPKKKVNVAANEAAVNAANPSFNAPLPTYHNQNVATPYTGNWYTYGESPQSAQYSAQVLPGAKRGGLMGYAHGGKVHGYAMGGAPMMQQAAPPPAMPPQVPQSPLMNVPPVQRPTAKPNPLATKAAFMVGHAIGRKLRSKMGTPPGPVSGPGGGQDDLIPAKLSNGEFVMPADVVSKLGDGSTDAGSKQLHGLMRNVRAHKAGKGFPAKAKNPLSYLPKGNA